MAAEQASKHPAVAPFAALMLSALVLPGLGQLLTGRLARGAVMAGALLLWAPLAAIMVGRDLLRVLPSLTARTEAGEILGFSDLQSALAPLAGGAFWLFLPLISIWAWSLADSIRYLIKNRQV